MANELVQLVDIYSSPGFLLLATDESDTRLGCVGLKDLGVINGRTTGEIRRLFVRQTGRTAGLGRSLLLDLIDRSKEAGFDRLVLNTLPTMVEAQGLYSKLGFEPCDPYVESPLEETIYLALDFLVDD